MTELKSKVLAALKARFGQLVKDVHSFRGDDTALIEREGVRQIAQFLRDDPGMDFCYLMDLTAVDYPRDELRFEVVYHFYSLKHNHRVRVKARLPEKDPVIDSLADLWPSADWFEREVWDMFGVRFRGHPNLRRILMYAEFVGHPLRKDYPLAKRQPLLKARDVIASPPKAGEAIS